MDDAIRRCPRCEQHLDVEAFSPGNGYCRPCMAAYQREYARAKPRRCKGCGVTFTRWDTYNGNGVHTARCHDCYLAYCRARYEPKSGKRAGDPWLHKGQHPDDVYGEKPMVGNRYWKELQERVWSEETMCGICGEWVDQSLPSRGAMGRVVDHIVPLIEGGATYQRSNLRLTHFSCNSRLGNRQGREQWASRLQYARAGLWFAQAAAW